MLATQEYLKQRRSELSTLMVNNSILILLSSELQLRNSDVEWPLRQDSSFWYLTGINEEKSALIITKDLEGAMTTTLFVNIKNLDEQIWTGPVMGADVAAEKSGITEVKAWSELLKLVQEIKVKGQTLYLDQLGSYSSIRNQINDQLYNRDAGRRGQPIPTVTKTASLINNLRLYKDELEISQMQEASRINVLAHQHAFQTIKSKIDLGQKVFEYEFQAELELVWRQHNCTWSYYPIVASGESSTILHYNLNNKLIDPTSFLLVDAGCEYDYYACDITRCYHFGQPTDAQTQIYNLVKRANLACIDHIASGRADMNSYHRLAVEVLTAGLTDLGILSGSLESNIADRSCNKYFMHGVGHYLGLDVHDAGSYYDNQGQSQKITTGMCLTVEPGLYFNKDDSCVPVEFRGIGVRIEDDILKTQDGVINLTERLDK